MKRITTTKMHTQEKRRQIDVGRTMENEEKNKRLREGREEESEGDRGYKDSQLKGRTTDGDQQRA